MEDLRMATNHSRTARKKQKKQTKKPLWKKIMISFLILFIATGLGVTAVFAYWIATAPKFDHDQLEIAYASQFYDKDGELFADKGAENRVQIEFDDLPEILIDAVIATEDARF